MAFRGNKPAKVDDKGRLKIPAEFFPGLETKGKEFFVTSQDGKRAEIHALRDWERIEEELGKRPASGAKKRFQMATNYFGQVVEMDAQGRLVIPQLLREAAELTGDVAVIGIKEHLEVVDNSWMRNEVTVNPVTDEDTAELNLY